MAVIRYTRGDILQADAEALVNTVNCVGVMGRGIALHFKTAFPDNFKAYAVACKRGEVRPGRMFVYETESLTPRWIINFPTKRHWRGKSRIEDIEAGMPALIKVLREREIRSVAIPPLGSGLGGLSWGDVRPIIERGLAELPDVEAIVYEPGGRAEEARGGTAPRMTAGRAALVGLIKRYLTGMMDTSITLLEVHKLMYFLQEAGEPLRLRYVRAPYGPYAENLRHVLRIVNGHLVDGYTAEGDTPTEEIELRPGAIERAGAFLGKHPDTRARFDRVGELVAGYETPFGLELLTTAHWVVSKEGARTGDDIRKTFYDWNRRKQQFEPEQIDIAIDQLRVEGWLPELVV